MDDPGNDTVPVEVEYDEIRNETSRHAATLNFVSKLLDTVEVAVVCLGLMANLIGSITLLKSRQMSTPSFVYHRALGLANLIYCFNFLLVKTVRQYAAEQRFPYGQAFTNYMTAFYMGVISRAVSSTCGYFVMYMSMMIIADRFLALIVFNSYQIFNRMKIAVRFVLISLILSALGHSWAPWIENEVRKSDIDVPSEDQIGFDTLSVYALVPRSRDASLRMAISVKDMYNLVIRLTYAGAQTILTICVIRAFHLQNRKRQALRTSPARTSRQLSNMGRERSLSCLMLAVAVLSCTQVLPREFKRIFDLVCPIDEILHLINDRSAGLAIRRRNMLLAVYGHGYWKLIANLLTALERSILFYLYFVLNHHFRSEVLAPFRKVKRWIEDRQAVDGTGRSGRRRSTLPSAKTSTNTLYSRTSTHTITLDVPNINTAIWINRKLSSFVMMLYANNDDHVPV